MQIIWAATFGVCVCVCLVANYLCEDQFEFWTIVEGHFEKHFGRFSISETPLTGSLRV